MAHVVLCVRNKKAMEGLDEPAFDAEFDQKIYKHVSKATCPGCKRKLSKESRPRA